MVYEMLSKQWTAPDFGRWASSSDCICTASRSSRRFRYSPAPDCTSTQSSQRRPACTSRTKLHEPARVCAAVNCVQPSCRAWCASGRSSHAGHLQITRLRLCESAPAALLPWQQRRAGKHCYQQVRHPSLRSTGIQSERDGRWNAAPQLACDRGIEQVCPLDAATSEGRTVRLEGAPTMSSLAHLAALGVIRGLRRAPLLLDKALILESLA